MKAIIINQIVAGVLAATTLSAQDFEWAKSFGGTSNDGGLCIAVDSSGNVYTTGYFKETVDFDPGPGTVTLTSSGSNDIFIHKMDASGNFLWAKSIGGPDAENGNGIAVDAIGNIYTTGFFYGTVDFDPGPGTANLTSNGAGGDVFVLKMDASGNFLWAKSFGKFNIAFSDYGNAINVDASGYVYITGDYSGFNGAEIFVHKMNSAGNFLWTKSFVGDGYDIGYDIAIDDLGNIYTTGEFSYWTHFDPNSGAAQTTSVGWADAFVHKMDASGNFQWVKTFGGMEIDVSTSITLDASGNVYTTGYFEDTVDFDPGPGSAHMISKGRYDIFVHKMDGSGNLIWVRTFGSNQHDGGTSISLDALGCVYTTGFFRGTVDFDPGMGTANLTSIGSDDIFVQKLDAFGNFLWAQSFGGVEGDDGNCITLNSFGILYTVGSFSGTADFDPGLGTASLTSVGSSDIFIQKTSQLGFGMADLGYGIQVLVYPNPNNGYVQILFEQEIKDVDITLTDIHGKTLLSKHLKNVSESDLKIEKPAGTYFLRLATSNGQRIVKLIKK